LDRRLGGPQRRSGRGVEEKNSQPLAGLELPIIQSVVQCCNNEMGHFETSQNTFDLIIPFRSLYIIPSLFVRLTVS
jgi:hypothetical protein